MTTGIFSLDELGCDRVAIGAPYNDGTASDAGHVRIYDLNQTVPP